MIPTRVRAPANDGGVVVAPEPGTIGGHLAANRVRLDAWNYDFQGRSAARLRTMARRQIAARVACFHQRMGLDPMPVAGDRPLVVTGHQPELFHPGVWAKNLAARQLADQAGGHALNLIVDIDVPHRHSIRVPVTSGDTLRMQAVEFDLRAGERPYEDETVRDAACFHSFPTRVRQLLGSAVAQPMLDGFWPLVERASRRTDLLGLRFAAARHAYEKELGLGTAEIPLSSVCDTEAFHWFVCHLLAQLPRFQEVHNQALAEYRSLYHLRSRHHPVPDLAIRGEWREAPFWVWRFDSHRRRPLLARQRGSLLELRIPDEDRPFLELPLSPDRDACCAVERLAALPASGIRLRTRALTTTMFARLLLGDLFIHGIGGAKYDELGDEILRRFFKLQPPTFLTLSMTLQLGLPGAGLGVDEPRQVRRLLREIQFQPDRHLEAPLDPRVAQWLEARRQAIADPVETRKQRVARFERIRECNSRLQEYLTTERAELTHRLERAERIARWNSTASSREFSFVLHNRPKLERAFLEDLPQALEIESVAKTDKVSERDRGKVAHSPLQ